MAGIGRRNERDKNKWHVTRVQHAMHIARASDDNVTCLDGTRRALRIDNVLAPTPKHCPPAMEGYFCE